MSNRTWLLGACAAVIVAIGLVLGSWRSAAHAQPRGSAQRLLVIAIQPSLSADQILERAKPFETALEAQLGSEVDVELYVPTSYAAVVEALRFGHAQAALMGSWPAKLAVDLAGAEIPLAEVRQVIHGQTSVEATHYFSYWIVPTDSPYQTLAELRGKRACFPSPISTSGYVAPLGRLVELGLVSRAEGNEADPASFFGAVQFGGGYGQCWAAVQHGQVDVTIIAGDVPKKLYREVLDATRTIEQQGPIPSHALVVSADLQEPMRARLITAMQAMGAPEHRELMRGVVSGIFVRFEPTSAEQHLQGLQRALQVTGLRYTERIGS